MNTEHVQQVIEQIVGDVRDWLQSILPQAMQASTPQSMEALERRFRDESADQVRRMYQSMLTAAAEAGDGGRGCPHCGSRRRHKGRRPRKILTSVGEVAIDGVNWQCPEPSKGGCGRHEHASARLGLGAVVTATGPLRELICLLGLSQSSFAHAGQALEKLMHIQLSTPTLAHLCEEEGRAIEAADPPPDRLVRGTLVGSCDGTMVHSREDGWRELRAWRFDDDDGRRASGAALEDAAAFTPRLRDQALRHHADQVDRFVFISDAAAWIGQTVAEHLPEASEHVIDIYHAYQHIHETARQIYGEGTEQAQNWARRWCDELYLRGGQAVRIRLQHARFRVPEQQTALERLLAYLQRHEHGMDYSRYRREAIPISSGPMESTCKQLGRRLKGPGMRWRTDNLTPMAHLISLWTDQRWDQYWTPAA